MKNNALKVVFLVAALVWTGLCLGSVREMRTVPAELGQAELAAELDLVLGHAMRDYTIAGVAAGAVQDGEVIWSARRGQRDAQGQPITGHTAFNLGSISKPLVVWTVLDMAEEGLLDLEAPIGHYLERYEPDYGDVDPASVTVRHLLEHTGGTNNHGYGGYGAHEDQPADIVELSADFQPLRVVREPGTARVYSGGGYVLLQMIVEDVTGESLDTVARQRVFEPLGMTDSGFAPDRLVDVSAAFNYYRRPIESLRDVAQAAAGGYASGDDIERFILAHLDGGGVLSPENLALALTPLDVANWTGMSYSLTATPDGLLAGHGGNNSTWHGQIYVRPATGDGFYFLTNATGGAQLDFDLSCAWLSWAHGEPVDSVCADATSLVGKVGYASAAIGVLALASLYWLAAGILSGRRALSARPRGRTALRLIGRLFLWLVAIVFLVLAIIVFFTDLLYWRTQVVFMDEIPVDEMEWLLPSIVALLASWCAALWSSPILGRAGR